MLMLVWVMGVLLCRYGILFIVRVVCIHTTLPMGLRVVNGGSGRAASVADHTRNTHANVMLATCLVS